MLSFVPTYKYLKSFCLVEVATRPESAKSDQSTSSKGSVASKKSAGSHVGSKIGSEKSKQNSRIGSRSSSKGKCYFIRKESAISNILKGLSIKFDKC